MYKSKFFIAVIVLLCVFVTGLYAGETLDLKLRFFEGVREGEVEPPKSVTSSYLQSTVTASIRSKFLLAEEQENIRKVFNLKEVRLITEADLTWEKKKSEKIVHMLSLDSQEYLVVIVPTEAKDQRYQFEIAVIEKGEKTVNTLLATDIILPGGHTAVFGFEDVKGMPYFMSFHMPGVKAAPPPPPPPPAPPVKKKIEEFERGAVKATGDIKPPKLIDKVNPVYPEEARKAKVEGVVILGARIDKEGNVSNVMVIKSKESLLNEAAMDAVRKWKYEPMVIEGKPVEAVFTVTISFKLNGKKEDEEFGKGAVKVGGEIENPRLIKQVNPIYPDEAKKAGIQGVVILNAIVDEKGNVARVIVKKSESAVLNQPAIDALKQWKYEPMIIKGKPKPVLITVTIKFRLK